MFTMRHNSFINSIPNKFQPRFNPNCESYVISASNASFVMAPFDGSTRAENSHDDSRLETHITARWRQRSCRWPADRKIFIAASSPTFPSLRNEIFAFQRVTVIDESDSRNMLLLKATIINCSRRHILPSFSSTYRSLASIASKETMSFEEDKQKFLRMSLEEKKKYYPLPIITLEQMCTWQEYWEKNNSSTGKTFETTDKVDEKLAKKVSVWHGDISSLQVDAIVNAANSSLLGGGGVDGAIHRAAGKILRKECETLGGCKVGEAKITGGYELPAKYVIHTVGPQSEKPELLRKCYENSLQLAKENKLRTIAFPCISTGIYGYPQKSAAKVALSMVMNFLLENMDAIDRVIFCVFLTSDKKIYDDLLQQYFGLE